MEKIKLSVTFIKEDTDDNINKDFEFEDKQKMAKYIKSLKGQGVFIYGVEYKENEPSLCNTDCIITENIDTIKEVLFHDVLISHHDRDLNHYLLIAQTYKEAFEIVYLIKDGCARRNLDTFRHFFGNN